MFNCSFTTATDSINITFLTPMYDDKYSVIVNDVGNVLVVGHAIGGSIQVATQTTLGFQFRMYDKFASSMTSAVPGSCAAVVFGNQDSPTGTA